MKMKTVVEIICNAGRLNKGIRFFSSPECEKYITYDELINQSTRILNQLKQAGICKGSEVILQLPDNYSFICCFWACLLGGIIAVPVPVATSESEYYRVHKIWRILGNPKIISNDQYLQNLCQYILDNNDRCLVNNVKKNYINYTMLDGNCDLAEIAEITEDDIAYLQFSSGSTGEPKGVVLTHRQIIANLEGITESAKIDENDTGISWMPLTHDMGIVGFHLTPSFLAIEHCLVVPGFFISNPIGYLELIHKHRYTITGAPNFGYALMTRALMQIPDNKFDLSCLRIMFNGAEPISIDIVEKFCAVAMRHGLKQEAVYPVYGLAEAVLAVSFPTPGNMYKYLFVSRKTLGWGDQVSILDSSDADSIRVISEGKTVKHCTIQINDKEDCPLQEGYAGQIVLKGKNITNGYYNAALGQEDIFDGEGWYKTGDIGFINNGEIYVVGRIKDIIFSNGRNLYANAIEKHIESVQPTLIGKVILCGINDFSSDSDRVVAFILFEGSVREFTDTAIFVKNCIFMHFGLILDDVIPVKEKYATMSGKLQRFKYIGKYQNGEYIDVCNLVHMNIESSEEAAVDHEPVGKLESDLIAICSETLNVDNVGLDDNFAQVSANSLRIVELYNKVCAYSKKNISVSDIYAHPTIRSLASYLNSLNQTVGGGIKIVGLEKNLKTQNNYIHKKESLSVDISKKIMDICKIGSASIQEVFKCAIILVIRKYAQQKEVTIHFADEEKIRILTVSEDQYSNFMDLQSIIRNVKNDQTVFTNDNLLRSGLSTDFFFLCAETSETLERHYKQFDMATYVQHEDGKIHLYFTGDIDSFGEKFYNSFRRDCLLVFTNIFIELESTLLGKP